MSSRKAFAYSAITRRASSDRGGFGSGPSLLGAGSSFMTHDSWSSARADLTKIKIDHRHFQTRPLRVETGQYQQAHGNGS